MTAAQPSGMECPQCGQVDQVQRVSAIVKSGTTTGTLTGTTTVAGDDASHLLTRDSQTLLSKLLASPKKPGAWWLRWRQEAWRGVIVALLALGVSLTIAHIVIKYSGNNHDPAFAIIVQGLFIGFGFIVLLLAVILTNGNRRYKTVRRKWKKSYYCHRCDGFFVPKETKLIAPEDMQLWLRARKWKTK